MGSECVSDVSEMKREWRIRHFDIAKGVGMHVCTQQLALGTCCSLMSKSCQTEMRPQQGRQTKRLGLRLPLHDTERNQSCCSSPLKTSASLIFRTVTSLKLSSVKTDEPLSQPRTTLSLSGILSRRQEIEEGTRRISAPEPLN